VVVVVITRQPPANNDAEIAVLGSVLLDNEVIEYIAGSLVSDDFYAEKHRAIFKAMMSLWQKGEPVDLVTLTEELRQTNKLETVGNVPYLIGLADSVPTAAYAENYAHIVHEKALLRESLRVAGQLMQLVYDGKAFKDVLEYVSESALALSQKGTGNKNTFASMEDMTDMALTFIEHMRDPDREDNRISTGLLDLDTHLGGGFTPGQLIILGARPSMGKSALALSMAATAGKTAPALFFALEMSTLELALRYMSVVGGVRADKMKQPETMTERDLERASEGVNKMLEHHVYVDDSPGLDIMQLRSKARQQYIKLGGLSAIFVDYLQLMAIDEGNTAYEYGKISRQLKNLARELGVPVIALSQLSRRVEQRPDKRPVLSDLRESGALEQDADTVIFIYRGEYYFPEDDSLKGVAELINAKQRNGPLGTVPVHFNGSFTRFSNLQKRP
jgi:replicative DNA helicase